LQQRNKGSAGDIDKCRDIVENVLQKTSINVLLAIRMVYRRQNKCLDSEGKILREKWVNVMPQRKVYSSHRQMS
jgi:hypothetical protein